MHQRVVLYFLELIPCRIAEFILSKKSVTAHLLFFLMCVFVDRLQPNVDTRQKQLAAWCSLALSYCRHHKLYTLDVMEAQESPVFNNKKIARILACYIKNDSLRVVY